MFFELGNYTGNSIVDYLISKGQDSSFENRRRIFARYYPAETYRGTADQNLKLLDTLRKDDKNGTPANLTFSEPKPQTAAQKQAYLTTCFKTIPSFSGSILNRMKAVKAYHESNMKSPAWNQAGTAEKEEIQNAVLKKLSDLFYQWAVYNFDEIKRQGGANYQFVKDFIVKYQMDIATGKKYQVSGLGSITPQTLKLIIQLVIGAAAVSGFAVYAYMYKKYEGVILEVETEKDRRKNAILEIEKSKKTITGKRFLKVGDF